MSPVHQSVNLLWIYRNINHPRHLFLARETFFGGIGSTRSTWNYVHFLILTLYTVTYVVWGWCRFGSIENHIVATQLPSITTTHTHIYITLFLETCFFCSQRQWCVKCVAQDGRGTPSLKGLDVFVFFLEKLRVSGAQFVWIIQASVPNGFHGSEGENAQKKKGVSTINIYLSAFPLFCFVIANWIKDLFTLNYWV